MRLCQPLDRLEGIDCDLVPVLLCSVQAKPGAAVFFGGKGGKRERMTSGRKRLNNKKRKKSESLRATLVISGGMSVDGTSYIPCLCVHLLDLV